MDLLIFLLSVIYLFFTRKIEIPFVGLLVLASDYLGIGRFFAENELNYFGQPKDLGLVLLMLISIVVLMRYKDVNPPKFVSKVYKYINLFLGFILFTIFIDFVANGIDAWSVARTSRHWLMLLIYIPLMRLPIMRLEKIVKMLYRLTLVVSFIIVIEYITGYHYFTPEMYETYAGNTIVLRGALPSTYALFYVLLVAMGYGSHNRVVRYFILAMLTFSLLISATKSIAIGLFVGFVALAVYTSRGILKALPKIFSVTILAFIIMMVMPSLRTRLIYGQQNFGTLDDGSTTFRMMLAEERYHYIAQESITYLFGIGNVTEDHFEGNFEVGHVNQEGERAQLDTGDIAWALTFLRLGMLGTILWIGLSLVFIWAFSKNLQNPYSIPLISYLLLNLLILSFAGTTIYEASYWIIPLIVLDIVTPYQRKIISR